MPTNIRQLYSNQQLIDNGVEVEPRTFNLEFEDTASVTWDLAPDGDTNITKVTAQAAGGGGGSIGYIGYDVLVNSEADLPAAVGGVITLAANTVYAINSLNMNGSGNRLQLSSGTVLIGGGGYSQSLITTNSPDPTITVTSNTAVKTLRVTNAGSGSCVEANNATNYLFRNVKFESANSANPAVRILGGATGAFFLECEFLLPIAFASAGIKVESSITNIFVNECRFSTAGTGNDTAILFDGGAAINAVQVGLTNNIFLGLANCFSLLNGANIQAGITISNNFIFDTNTFLRADAASANNYRGIVVGNNGWQLVAFYNGLSATSTGNLRRFGNFQQGLPIQESPTPIP